MIDPLFIKAMARELGALLSGEQSARVPEPELLMKGGEQVKAFSEAASREMASIYYFNALHISALIRPGDLVVDLACGPASQLAILAKLNPDAEFLGIDLSAPMLALGRDRCQALPNVRFETMNITRMEGMASASAELVYSTLSLHHLPDSTALDACFAEIARVLKPGGRVYLHDFARQRSGRAMEVLARQYADRRPKVIVEDYLNSMRAAFLPRDFQQAARRHFGGRARLFVNPLFRYMMVLAVGAEEAAIRAEAAKTCRDSVAGLELSFRADHAALRRLFAFSGLPTPKSA